MAVEERLRNKYLYKALIVILKYTPLVITGFYVINTLLNLLEIDTPAISNIAGVSLLTWIFLLLSNIVFKFCICHRMFLYYILAVDLFEKFDMYKAKEVCQRYRGILPISVNTFDVYAAINSHYHNYAELFRSWFGDDIEHKIIESAIVYWFKDDDHMNKHRWFKHMDKY